MSANHEKGKRWEREVVEVLRAHGHLYAERALRLGAHDDRGDIDGVFGFYFDAKDRHEHQLSTWMDEVVLEARAADARLQYRDPLVPVLVVKRRRASAERGIRDNRARLICGGDSR